MFDSNPYSPTLCPPLEKRARLRWSIFRAGLIGFAIAAMPAICLGGYIRYQNHVLFSSPPGKAACGMIGLADGLFVVIAPFCGIVGAVFGGLIAAILNWVGNLR